jgi:uncharacterized protein YbjT (DUF2867 family)
VPGDLLRYVSAPTPYPPWWLWTGILLLLAVIVWYAGVFVWTLPSQRLRGIPVIRVLHAKLLRRRYSRTIRSITGDYRSGSMSGGEACESVSRTLRSFFHQATGTRAQYMHVSDIAAGDLAAAAPLLSALGEVRFSPGSQADIAELASAAEELIRSWT